MTIRDKFESYFTEDYLKQIFVDHVIYSSASGIDNLDQYAFRSMRDEQVEILSRKVIAGTYNCSKYKLKLISKGRGKVPREISIPTIRDRIALRALCDFLSELYKSTIDFNLPQNIAKKVKVDVSSGVYDGYIKLDVSNFYPSIKHAELLKRLKRKIRHNSEIINFISSAITTPTVSHSKSNDKLADVGVPQGLAISNILAAIYLINIDKFLNSYPNIKYYRYVDDVLIFCEYAKAESIAKEVIQRFLKIGLEIHDPKKSPDKSKISKISSSFDYLGYQFKGELVSARIGSIDKLRTSLVNIFTAYKHSKNKSEKFLLWRLNLRVTGCIFQSKSKGWLFFFAEINDESLLHQLDYYVSKLVSRFDVKISPKKFVRAFKELKNRKYETTYIPNFDNYDTSQMKSVLTDYFGKNISGLTDEEVEYEFHKRISKQVKDLLEDIKSFS